MRLLRPTAFFRPNNISKVTIIKKTKSATIAFFLLLLSSFLFVSVILELIGPKKPAF